VPVRGPLTRLLWWTGGLAAGALAVVGGLGLRGPGLVAVGVAAMLAACTAVGIARDVPGSDHRSLLEAAVQAAAWTVGILLALGGVAVLAGGLAAVSAAATVALAWWAVRLSRARGRRAGSVAARTAPAVDVPFLPVPDAGGLQSVSGLTTPALGREWLRTTAALRGRLSPSERSALVRRREQTLDELERRDPAGFARWLADGPSPASDPATYLEFRPVQDDPTAGTDAA
jgi:hypothetical protein